MALAENVFIGSGRGRDHFPSKLYKMLESVDSLGLSHIVSWLPHGKSFEVKDPDQFMDLVVPKLCQATQYRSFQRQLNLWGFERQAGTSVWQHKYFFRGSPQFLSKISRTRVKNKGSRRPEAAGKRKEAKLHAPSDDSSEGASASDYISNEEKVLYEDTNFRDVSRQQTSNTGSSFVPAPFKDEVFESSTFFERAPNQSQSTNIDEMYLEPLPIDSAGILDSTSDRNKSDLAEFGQLLGRL